MRITTHLRQIVSSIGRGDRAEEHAAGPEAPAGTSSESAASGGGPHAGPPGPGPGVRVQRAARAAVGVVTVAGAIGLVAMLVVAFGLRSDPNPAGAPVEDVAEQVRPRGSPNVTTLNLSRSPAGATITLLRVERLGRGGRVYLKARNRAAGRIAIPDSDIRLSQRYGRALPAPDPFVGRLPSFGPFLAPGETATSVRYFPRLRRGGAVVEVQWFSNDPDLDPEPVSFSFEVT